MESTGGLGWLRGRILRPQAGVGSLVGYYTHSGLKDSPSWLKMNPQASQFSTSCPFSGNAPYRPGSTLPRSFKPPSHEIRLSGPFYALLMAHLRPNSPQGENGLTGHSRTSHGDTFAFYSNSLEQSLRMQDAGPRNAKVVCLVVLSSAKVNKNTFLSFVQGGGKNRLSEADRELYTLLDYIALSTPSSKTAKKGTE